MCLCGAGALCCAGASCCTACCCGCEKAGVNPKNYSKIGYVFFQIIWIVISIALLYTAQPLFEKLPGFMQCPTESGGGGACFGVSAICRMSFTLAVFHFMMLIAILPRNEPVAIFHDGCWLFKTIFVLIVFIGTLWIDNYYFTIYSEISRIISVFFLIYQALLMLVVAYKINELLVSNAENDEGRTSTVILIVVTVVAYLLCFVFIGFQIYWFGKSLFNWIILIITGVSGASFVGLVFLRTREDASILTSALAWLYILYLSWAAMASSPNPDVNPFYDSSENTLAQIVLGLFFTFAALLTISATTIKDDDTTIAAAVNGHMMEKEPEGARHASIQEADEEGGQNSGYSYVFPISTATILFQILLILASVYYSMLLTNWGNPMLFDGSHTDFFKSNTLSFWLKLGCQWISIGIYLFSLLGPLCFPDREF